MSDPTTSFRDAIVAALRVPGAPTQRDLAAAVGIDEANLSAWLAGRRKTIPLRAIEAMIVRLDLVIGPRLSPARPRP